MLMGVLKVGVLHVDFREKLNVRDSFMTVWCCVGGGV